MKITLVALGALLSATSANALTYLGSLTAGGTTATYSIVTDGTLGVIGQSNIVSTSGTVSNGNGTNSFANGNFLFLNGGSVSATATTLSFDSSQDGTFIFGDNLVTFPVVCLTGGQDNCNGEPPQSVFIARDFYALDFEWVPSTGIYTIGTVAVPEPASWAMLIAGFGLTGAAMRRRRTAALQTA